MKYIKARDRNVRKNNQLLSSLTSAYKIIASYKSLFFASLTDSKWIRILDDVTIKETTEDPAQQNQSTTKTLQPLHLNYLLSHGNKTF
jgi:hypothetical protein